MQGLRIKEYVDKLIDEKGIPYLDILVQKEHKTLFRYLRDKDGQATEQTQLFLYSCTKPLTVACAMKLIEEGKLSLNDEVAKYLPEYGNAFLLGENGEKRPTKNKMTVRQLLTMTGGLNYDFGAAPVQELVKRGGGTTVEFANAFIKSPLSFEPGERFQYSLCLDVISAIIEVVTGKRFSEYMQETLFEPLGMHDCFFHGGYERVGNLYICDDNGKITQMDKVHWHILSENQDGGGSGVIGTVEDYAKFADALACGGVGGNGRRILKESSINEAAKEQLSHLDTISVDNAFTCVQGGEYGYGFGMRTRLVPTEWGLPKGEFGWDGAAGSYLMVDKERGISVVIGMHLLNWPMVFTGEHLNLVKCVYEDMHEEDLLSIK